MNKQNFTMFAILRGDNSGLKSPMFLIFNRVQVLIDIKTLSKFGKNMMKNVDFIA